MRGELTVTVFSMRHARGGWQREILFALPLREGDGYGQQDSKLIGKGSCEKKFEWGETTMRGEVTVTILSMQLVSMGWQWQVLIHLVF